MSLEAKITFSEQLREQLGHILTVDNVDQTMDIVSNCLVRFDMEIIEVKDGSGDDLLSTYINAIKVRGLSDKTVTRYKYLITRLLSYLRISTSEITVHHLRDYLTSEKERCISDNTLNGYRQVYCAFFNWLQKEGLIKRNPTANLGIIKKKKKVKDIFTDMDIERMKRGCQTLRDRAIVCFLLSTACRISEMVNLNVKDVDLVNLECKVLGKGDKERIVYLDSVTGMLLNEYFNLRTDNSEALFVGLRSGKGRITPSGVRVMLKRLEKTTGVTHIHPHKFRRTKATDLIKHGMPIQEVAAILGHEKIDTTMEYIVIDNSMIKSSYKKYA